MENNQTIRSVQRSIDILQCLKENNEELTMTEISEITSLAKSTVSRLLYTLEINSFVEKDPNSGKYRLGRELYFLGNIAGRSIQLKEEAKDIMERLRDQLRETINLYVLDGKYRTCILQYESLQSVKHMIQIGQKLPLTVGASGKVFLAYQDSALIQELMKEQKMIQSEKALLQELTKIKLEKYASSIEEREEGTSAAAAPIFNVNGEITGALSVSGPSNRFNPTEIKDLKTILVASALEISTRIGYHI